MGNKNWDLFFGNMGLYDQKKVFSWIFLKKQFFATIPFLSQKIILTFFDQMYFFPYSNYNFCSNISFMALYCGRWQEGKSLLCLTPFKTGLNASHTHKFFRSMEIYVFFSCLNCFAKLHNNPMVAPKSGSTLGLAYILNPKVVFLHN